MKEKVSAGLAITGLVAAMGIAGAVESKADGIALEVVSQTWYELPKKKQEKYCETKDARDIVKKEHKNVGRGSKKKLRKAYKIFWKDC